MNSHHPIVQLILANIRGYLREPEAIFWTYGFPLLMVVGLGIAFDTSKPNPVLVDVVQGPGSGRIIEALSGNDFFRIHPESEADAMQRLRRNRTQIVAKLDSRGVCEYYFDPSNPDARTARAALDDALQKAWGRQDPLSVNDRRQTVPGARYVDFLVPGLIGMNLMGGGMWGVGFMLVDMRIKKLLKRMLGTPMKRPQLLLATIGTRAVFFIPEMFVLLLTAHWIFGVPVQGSIVDIVIIALIGSLSFAGLGLLAASRAQRIESITGILNLTMFPMWLCSGIFFSADRFPAAMQPFVQALPLTQLINALRAVILEGVALPSQTLPILVLTAWGGASFLLALKLFRWN
jgi:ABC-2 type transport system permease protein